mmetsp:Transcript_35087/g.79364  ORF Transcript_35087/g.79364 Transcript_35087/m.79364 type:complete len:205 (-) Transcript_35087:467-1081(-)
MALGEFGSCLHFLACNRLVSVQTYTFWTDSELQPSISTRSRCSSNRDAEILRRARAEGIVYPSKKSLYFLGKEFIQRIWRFRTRIICRQCTEGAWCGPFHGKSVRSCLPWTWEVHILLGRSRDEKAFKDMLFNSHHSTNGKRSPPLCSRLYCCAKYQRICCQWKSSGFDRRVILITGLHQSVFSCRPRERSVRSGAFRSQRHSR